jgi:transposase
LLVTGGDNPARLTSEAAFAARCGAGPAWASSGTTVRHRRNRGGDRTANTARWTIAHVRLVHDPRTRRDADCYADRRRAAGNRRKEILRLVKRSIARERYPIILRSS